MDFTLKTYTELLQGFQKSGYSIITFEDYCKGFDNNCLVILRHDVDEKSENSLMTAQIEHSLGIRASYYFRHIAKNDDSQVIKMISSLGHEIGYHYEDMALCRGNAEKAVEQFKHNLDYFRRFYPVKTICMHGSPGSRYDNVDLWKYYDYHSLGIIGEPYFDIDFSKLFYLTDTGRRWDGNKVSIRDKVPDYQYEWMRKGWVYRSTSQIISALDNCSFPKRLMLTTHPQRWTDNRWAWLQELMLQSAKNIVKRGLVFLK